MLSQAIDIHAALGTARDQQWINIALSFLKSYVDDHGSDLLVPEDDKAAYVSRIVKALHDAVNNLDSGMFILYRMRYTYNIHVISKISFIQSTQQYLSK